MGYIGDDFPQHGTGQHHVILKASGQIIVDDREVDSGQLNEAVNPVLPPLMPPPELIEACDGKKIEDHCTVFYGSKQREGRCIKPRLYDAISCLPSGPSRMNALLFPLAVITIWSILGLGIGYGMRKLLGHNQLVLGLVLFGLLVPWMQHHLELTRQAASWLAHEAGRQMELPLAAVATGPSIVVLVAAIAVAMSRRLGRLVAAVPAVAFYVTYYLTFPLVHNAAPGFRFDNMPNIWLFMWTIGATILVLAYRWPIRPTDIDKAKEGFSGGFAP